MRMCSQRMPFEVVITPKWLSVRAPAHRTDEWGNVNVLQMGLEDPTGFEESLGFAVSGPRTAARLGLFPSS